MSRRRRVDPRRIKIHRSYTVEQLAQLLGCHKNSVRLWLKQGLETLDDGKRPLLIQGSVARQFLETRRRSRKHRCQLHELYCLRCQEPRAPEALRAHYLVIPGQADLMSADCSVCAARMFKRVADNSLAALEQSLELKICEGEETPKMAA